MAKEIKTIQCPNCGSVDKNDIGNDRFICKNCSTEYYLDDDYTHVVHHHKNYDYTETDSNNKNQKSRIALVILVPIIIFSVLIFALINFNSNKLPETSSFERDLLDEELILTKNKSDELLYALIGVERVGNFNENKKELVAYFFDKNAKKLKKQNIDYPINNNFSAFPCKSVSMSNGDNYLIYNEKSLFKINPNQLEVIELKGDFFKHPKLASGIAKIEEFYDQDGFKIITQDGKSYAYLPIIDKLIETDKIWKEKHKIPPNAEIVDCFKFCTFSNNGISKLFKYRQKQQIGYLKEEPFFDCDDRNLSGKEPYIRFNNVVGLVDYKLLTDRTFFNPMMLGYNDSLIIVSITTDAIESSPKKIQGLNLKNADVKWTLDLSNKATKQSPMKSLSNKDFTIVETNNSGLTIDNKTGKEVAELKF